MTQKPKPPVFKALDLEKFIAYWNERYPLDQWYRKKYGIAFGSEEHKRLNFINMAIELKEQLIIDRTAKLGAQQEEDDFFNSGLPGDTPGAKDRPITKVKRMSQKEIDKEFEELDFVKMYNEQKSKTE